MVPKQREERMRRMVSGDVSIESSNDMIRPESSGDGTIEAINVSSMSGHNTSYKVSVVDNPTDILQLQEFLLLWGLGMQTYASHQPVTP